MKSATGAASSWTGGALGARGGATLGATIGSIFPVVGTAIGGFIVGAIGGMVGSYGGRFLSDTFLINYMRRRKMFCNKRRKEESFYMEFDEPFTEVYQMLLELNKEYHMVFCIIDGMSTKYFKNDKMKKKKNINMI